MHRLIPAIASEFAGKRINEKGMQLRLNLLFLDNPDMVAPIARPAVAFSITEALTRGRLPL
ncbi:MAG: hypothetical protein V4695_00885 [Pseudomonadota bacterium]